MCNFSFHLTLLVACANSQFAKLCMANYRDWCISGISTICFVTVVIRSPNSQSKKQSQFSVIYGAYTRTICPPAIRLKCLKIGLRFLVLLLSALGGCSLETWSK